MPISFQPSHKVELRVEVGKTSVEELQKLKKQAASKGGGEIRARKNEDGSHTLYVAADKKVRLRAIFGQSWGATARTGKVNLAKDLMKEIILRRLPSSDASGPSAASAKALMSRIDTRSSSKVLGDVLADLPKESHTLGHVMSTPGMTKAFGESMKTQFVHENFEFLRLTQEYDKTTEPQAKLRLAEQIFKMVETPENPPAQEKFSGFSDAPAQINISSAMAGRIHREMQDLRAEISGNPQPSDSAKQRLNDLFSEAQAEVAALVRPNVAVFVRTEAYQTEMARETSVEGRVSDNPASRLAPGSGAEFAERLAQASTLDNVLSDPEVRSDFKDHLAGTKHAATFERFEQIEGLAYAAENGDVSDAALLHHCEELFLNSVPEEERDNPFFYFFSDQLTAIRDEHQALSGDAESRALQRDMFGGTASDDSLVRDKLKDFLSAMKADAANGLRGDGLKSFASEKLGTIVAGRMRDEQLQMRGVMPSAGMM